MSGNNRLFKSGKTIRLRWDFCRSRISAGFGKVPDSGRSRNPVQPYITVCKLKLQEAQLSLRDRASAVHYTGG